MDIDPRLRESLASLGYPGRPGLGPVEVRLRRGGDARALEERLGAIAAAVAEACPGVVSLGDDRGLEPPARPALTLVGGAVPPIHYLALPEGPEAAPFAEALAALSAGGAPSSATSPSGEPADVLLLVAPGCPNCPQAVRAAISLLSSGHHLLLAVVDVTAFPDLVEPFKPRSVPVTVVDRRIAVVGVIPTDRLGRLLQPPGSRERDREVLAALLESGLLTEAAAELRRSDGVEAFVALWSVSTLQSRMGLVLVAEEALAHDPRALDLAVPGLRAALGSGDRARRGDTAGLLGAIGSRAARAALEPVVDDEDEEVAEAAREALDELGT